MCWHALCELSEWLKLMFNILKFTFKQRLQVCRFKRHLVWLIKRSTDWRGGGGAGSEDCNQVSMITPVKKFGQVRLKSWFHWKDGGIQYGESTCKLFAFFTFKHLRKSSSCPTSKFWTFWKIYCHDHSSLWSTTTAQIYELFHIYLTSFHSSREI